MEKSQYSTGSPDEYDDLGDIVGSGNFFDDSETLENYSSDRSFVPSRSPSCGVKPENREEIQKIVEWANDTNTPLIPISSGLPRFRGDTIPRMGGVVIDLSKMNEIPMIDRRNRVAMVEPGVRFEEFKEKTEEKGLRPSWPLVPRSTKSILTSYLEREPIITPKYQFDISDPLLCTEVIFGTGDLFRTGSAAGPGSLEDQREKGQAHANPMGPSQTDLFRVIQGAQGTMGIVTWATVKCEVLPTVQSPFFATSEKVETLLELAYRLLRRRWGDEILLLNDFNLAKILRKNSEDILNLSRNLPSWILFISFDGYEKLPEEKVEYQVKGAKDIAKQVGVEMKPSVEGISGKEVLDHLQSPSEEPYWKIRHKDSCKDILFLTEKGRVPQLTKIVYKIAERYRYPAEELGVYIQPVVQGTAYHCEFNISYNSENEHEVRRAQKFYEIACEELIEEGAFFSRPYGSVADMVYRRDAESTAALRKAKEIFDPNEIMNPGKLCL